MIKTRGVKGIVLQIASTILAFVGSFVLIGTLVPLLNPSEWQSAQNAAGGSQGQGWTWKHYLVWFSIGLCISGCTLGCAWWLNKKNLNKVENKHITVLFWLIVSAAIGVLGWKELPVRDDAAGVVDEGDQLRLNHSATDFDMRSEHRVELPHLVRITLGEGQPALVVCLGWRSEQVVLLDQPEETRLRTLLPGQGAAFDAAAIDHHLVIAVLSELGQYPLDRLGQRFRADLALLPLVFARPVFEHFDTALLRKRVPRLDGAPFEDMRQPLLIMESALRDLLNAAFYGVSLGRIDRSEYPELHVNANTSHFVPFC